MPQSLPYSVISGACHSGSLSRIVITISVVVLSDSIKE